MTRIGQKNNLIVNMKQPSGSGWLPRDERKLLAFYYSELPRPKTNKTYQILIHQMKVLGYIEGSEKPENSTYLTRVMDTHDNLVERGLAVIEQGSMGMNVTVSLTLEGRDLGRKYSCWFTRSGLWFAEYKHHWVWIFVAYLGGIVTAVATALVVKWLTGNST